MPLTNDQIEANVKTLAAAIMKDMPVKPEEVIAVAAGLALVVNVLQNLNDIAAHGASHT